jgi:hypothetical protein
MPLVFGDRHALTPEIHRHYTMPFDSARERTAPWVAAWELAGSGDWLDALPGAEVEEYADAGHVVLEEAGAAVLPRLTSFMRRCRYRRLPDARRAS